jgi:hypothetical protein
MNLRSFLCNEADESCPRGHFTGRSRTDNGGDLYL